VVTDGKTTFHSLATTASVGVCENLHVSVSVTHTGPPGDVVVTAFLEFLNASVPVPNLALVAFTKAYNMTDGETRVVSLTVEPEQRAVITNETYERTVEPQPFRLWVGNGLPEQKGGGAEYVGGESGVQEMTVSVTGVATVLKKC